MLVACVWWVGAGNEGNGGDVYKFGGKNGLVVKRKGWVGVEIVRTDVAHARKSPRVVVAARWETADDDHRGEICGSELCGEIELRRSRLDLKSPPLALGALRRVDLGFVVDCGGRGSERESRSLAAASLNPGHGHFECFREKRTRVHEELFDRHGVHDVVIRKVALHRRHRGVVPKRGGIGHRPRERGRLRRLARGDGTWAARARWRDHRRAATRLLLHRFNRRCCHDDGDVHDYDVFYFGKVGRSRRRFRRSGDGGTPTRCLPWQR